VIERDVTAWEIIYAVLRVRLLWPLIPLLYLCIGMHLKLRSIEYRTRQSFGDASAGPKEADWVVHQTRYPAVPVSSAQESDPAESSFARRAWQYARRSFGRCVTWIEM
jgi:hypothetical protein